MSDDTVARWEWRFHNFKKALIKLEEAIHEIKENYPPDTDGNISGNAFLDDIIKEGLIQRFEYTHELAWNVMKDFLAAAGNTQIFGSKDATRAAFSAGLIADGAIWMEMIQSRNSTSHIYNEPMADDIFFKIMDNYYNALISFRIKMQTLTINN